MTLPTDPAARKAVPVFSGALKYFPRAIAAVAELSRVANDQHNPGEPMHWARGKSTDHGNKIIRHLLDAGTVDSDGTRHSAKVAWRALALLQEELEAAGAPLPRNARLPLTAAQALGMVSMDPPVVDETTARAMLRDRVIPDDDESPTPAEPAREHA
jgi:hypothetical protein